MRFLINAKIGHENFVIKSIKKLHPSHLIAMRYELNLKYN